VIEVHHLTKRYGNHEAVSDLSFTVETGQIYGFLGPNGAGKSTTMNMITGCIAATEGQILINGHDIFEDAAAAKKCIGYLPEQPPVYLDMTPLEYLMFVAQAKKVPANERHAQVAHAIAVTQIESVQNRLIKHLSKGYRQRVGIAQALLGDPEIIILDEPTVGLDPLQIIEIRDLIKSLGETHTVILSSHILSEIQAVCDAVLIISKGKLVACDTTENLEKLFSGNNTLTVTVHATEAEARRALASVEGITSLDCTAQSDNSTKLEITSAEGVDLAERVFFAFADIRRPIVQMSAARASLEDVFIELTNNAATDAPAAAPVGADTASAEAPETGEEEPTDGSNL
jgi:ABC-2 type transport system ATP-binding protein